MTEFDVPDAAGQIVREALKVRRGYLTTIDNVEALRVVAALARGGWLHDPARVAALRAVAEAAGDLDRAIDRWVGVALSADVARAHIGLENALDAVPVMPGAMRARAEQGAPPPGAPDAPEQMAARLADERERAGDADGTGTA